MQADGYTDRHTDMLITIFHTPTSGEVKIATLKITKKLSQTSMLSSYTRRPASADRTARRQFLSASANCTVLRAVVLTQYRLVTDRRMDRQVDGRTELP